MNAIGFVIGDGDGAPEFKRQAAEWVRFMKSRGDEARIVVLDVAKLPIGQRFNVVRAHLVAIAGGTAAERVGQVAFFCHGWSAALQLCPKSRVQQLAEAIAAAGASSAVLVTLYSCSTGSDLKAATSEVIGEGPGGDGGFADMLRDALCAAEAIWCRVDAHTVLGHTTRNPYLRRFSGLGVSTGGIGGQWLVTPKSAAWSRWVTACKGTLRWRFPMMAATEIHAELAEL